MEKLLAALWKKLLKIEDISLEDNFFRLGGDSVLSMQLVSIARARGVTLTVQDIFRNASLRGLAVTAREDTQTVEKTYLGTAPSISMPPEMNSYIKYLVEADRHAAVGFWSSYLAGTDTKPLHRPGEPFPNITIPTGVFDIFIVRDRDLTLSTIIEAATGLVLAHHIGCTDVILCAPSDWAGAAQLRVWKNRVQRVSDLLHAAQAFQGEMLQHEHLGFFELNKMEDLSPILQNSYHVNVNPAPTSVLGTGLGMRLHQTQMQNADPLGYTWT
ncbi:hypothetical protein AB5N19_05097 [Seiridium cardinale]